MGRAVCTGLVPTVEGCLSLEATPTTGMVPLRHKNNNTGVEERSKSTVRKGKQICSDSYWCLAVEWKEKLKKKKKNSSCLSDREERNCAHTVAYSKQDSQKLRSLLPPFHSLLLLLPQATLLPPPLSLSLLLFLTVQRVPQSQPKQFKGAWTPLEGITTTRQNRDYRDLAERARVCEPVSGPCALPYTTVKAALFLCPSPSLLTLTLNTGNRHTPSTSGAAPPGIVKMWEGKKPLELYIIIKSEKKDYFRE